MFELLTTDDLARWFAALDDAVAEDVAATLDVVAQLGAGTEAPGSSEWLLWYEHPALAERARRPSEQIDHYRMGLRYVEQWGSFLGYVKRVLAHLDSPRFIARIAHLSERDASAVTHAVRRIRACLKARPLAMSELARKHGPKPLHAAAMGGLCDLTEVRHWYFAALSAAGFAVEDVPPHSAALREIGVRSPEQELPGLRLLYGVDAPRNRGLVVLGERLDRSFYGDSVRRAEHLWQQFLDGTLPSTHASSLR